MSAPYSYEFINSYNSTYDPSTVHCRNTSLTWYFKRYLLQRAFSVFKWELPKNWSPEFFKYVLYMCGYVIIVNTDKFGVIPMIGGLRGYNVMYQPTHAIITSPLISGILEPEIDTQCAVIKMNPDYCGIGDLISYYAEQMALAGEASAMNLINSKLAYMVGARNKAMAEAMKKGFDQVQAGNPLIVFDKTYQPESGQEMFETFTQNLQQNFIAPDIMLSIRKLENEFDSKIGLANVNTEKKERLIEKEVQANRDETYALAEGWMEEINRGIDKAKELFNLEKFSVDWRFDHNDPISTGTLQQQSEYPERNNRT